MCVKFSDADLDYLGVRIDEEWKPGADDAGRGVHSRVTALLITPRTDTGVWISRII